MIKGDTQTETQIAIIGAGPGGYAAAFHAADLGFAVTLIDTEALPGGVCLHRGCIPSKALLHAARILTESEDAEAIGIHFGKPRVNLTKLNKWKDGVISGLSHGLAILCQARGVTHITGHASFLDAHTLKIFNPPAAESELHFDTAIIATGSRPTLPPFASADSKRIMTSTAALTLSDIPKKLLVVGGGYIGLELGTVYAALGSQVTVVEAGTRLLPGVDADLVAPLARRLAKQFHAIHTDCSIAALTENKKGLSATLHFTDGKDEQLLFDKALIAIGRKSNASGLGLRNTQVKVDDKGFIITNAARRTHEPNIFAIGDVAGEPMLAHKAAAEAEIAAMAIAGKNVMYEPLAIPAVVFTDPEIAWCGLTEAAATTQGRAITVTRFPWAASGRAATLGRSDGVTKLICDPTSGRVLGVGLCGPNAGDLIAEGTLAIEMGATATDLALTTHPHPTLSETLKEAAEAIIGQATHLFRAPKS